MKQASPLASRTPEDGPTTTEQPEPRRREAAATRYLLCMRQQQQFQTRPASPLQEPAGA